MMRSEIIRIDQLQHPVSEYIHSVCADITNEENSARDVVTFDEHCHCDPQSWFIAVHRPVSGLARVATETKGDQSVQKVRYLPRRLV